MKGKKIIEALVKERRLQLAVKEAKAAERVAKARQNRIWLETELEYARAKRIELEQESAWN